MFVKLMTLTSRDMHLKLPKSSWISMVDQEGQNAHVFHIFQFRSQLRIKNGLAWKLLIKMIPTGRHNMKHSPSPQIPLALRWASYDVPSAFGGRKSQPLDGIISNSSFAKTVQHVSLYVLSHARSLGHWALSWTVITNQNTNYMRASLFDTMLYSVVYCANEILYIPSTAGTILLYQRHATRITNLPLCWNSWCYIKHSRTT